MNIILHKSYLATTTARKKHKRKIKTKWKYWRMEERRNWNEHIIWSKTINDVLQEANVLSRIKIQVYAGTVLFLLYLSLSLSIFFFQFHLCSVHSFFSSCYCCCYCSGFLLKSSCQFFSFILPFHIALESSIIITSISFAFFMPYIILMNTLSKQQKSRKKDPLKYKTWL